MQSTVMQLGQDNPRATMSHCHSGVLAATPVLYRYLSALHCVEIGALIGEESVLEPTHKGLKRTIRVQFSFRRFFRKQLNGDFHWSIHRRNLRGIDRPRLVIVVTGARVIYKSYRIGDHGNNRTFQLREELSF